LLSIVTMIWYASANFGWTWLWYVFGIATGVAILLTFAVFEKKKTLATKGT
jgi:phosphotransferase system  glucose/maltose/N-acetylglucosamine-specific IIC component